MEADIVEWIDGRTDATGGRTTHVQPRGKRGKWCEGGADADHVPAYILKTKWNEWGPPSDFMS